MNNRKMLAALLVVAPIAALAQVGPNPTNTADNSAAVTPGDDTMMGSNVADPIGDNTMDDAAANSTTNSVDDSPPK